jgi:hypothetical protein
VSTENGYISEDEVRAILVWLDEGKTNKEISRLLGYSLNSTRRRIQYARGRREAGPRPYASVEVADGERDFGPIPSKLGMVSTRQVPVLIDPEREPLQGGRLSKMSGGYKIDQIIPPPEAGDWRLENVSPEELRRMAPADLITRMVRISPEIARAYFDFLRMANPGHKLEAVAPGTDQPHEEGQAYLDFCEYKLSKRQNRGSPDVVYNMQLANCYVRGALFTELVLDSAAREFVDIVVPDAYSARFKVINDPEVGGQAFQLVQGTGRDAVVLDRITVKFAPIDPLPDSPYGTSPVAPGLFPAIFLITMLQDARRVIAQQGWPRLDIMIEVAQIIEIMPEQDRDKPEAIQAWVQKAVDEVASSYSELDPDEAWVHTSTVQFGNPIGAIGNLEGVDAMIAVLERMAVRGLKSQPLLFGMQEGVSEANANRQWEVHVAGVRALQQIVAQVNSELYTLALEAQGIEAEAKFSFDELRAIERLREAQADFQLAENAQMYEVLGYKTHDEASVYATGRPAAEETTIGMVGDDPEDNPMAGAVAAGDTGDEGEIQGDDGQNEGESEEADDSDRSLHMQQLRTLEAVFSHPSKAMAMAMAMRILTGRDVPKLKPKGGPRHSGFETVRVGIGDLTDAKRDFNYRMSRTGNEEYQGILDAETLVEGGEDQ